jgi:hypothetical protein
LREVETRRLGLERRLRMACRHAALAGAGGVLACAGVLAVLAASVAETASLTLGRVELMRARAKQRVQRAMSVFNYRSWLRDS